VEAGDFADELKGSVADFVRGHWRFKIEEGFDVSAHKRTYGKRNELEVDFSRDSSDVRDRRRNKIWKENIETTGVGRTS